MALMRHWKGRPRGLRELPAEVREAPLYTGSSPECGAPKDWYVDRIRESLDGRYYKLEFDPPDHEEPHYWRFYEGTWVRSGPPPWEQPSQEPTELTVTCPECEAIISGPHDHEPGCTGAGTVPVAGNGGTVWTTPAELGGEGG
jgi:hypothetical protein